MGLASLFVQAVQSAIDISEARAVVQDGLSEALNTMSGMVVNPGQQTVYNDYVLPAFQENIGPVEEGWTDVDIGEYMDFMGEIVEEGNEIMANAYDLAQEILSELEEAIEEGYYEE